MHEVDGAVLVALCGANQVVAASKIEVVMPVRAGPSLKHHGYVAREW